MVADILPDSGSEFGARVRKRLAEEQVIWLTTTGGDGTPQPNPVWFLWEGPATMLIYNRSEAHRLGHLAARPRVSLHLDGDGRGGNIVVLGGRAERVSDVQPSDENQGYQAKYGDAMVRISGSLGAFAAAYPVAIRVHIDRVRGH